MNNPGKYIRKAFIDSLGSLNIPIYDTAIPNDIDTPKQYILLSSQTKNEKNRSKCDKMWSCSINIEIYNRSNRASVSTAILDDFEQQITDIITPDIRTNIDLSAAQLKVYYTYVDQPQDLPQWFGNETVSRRILRFRFDIGEAA